MGMTAVLKNSRIQVTFHSFYASRFCQSGKMRFKKSKPNQAVVQFFLRKKTGKWLLRRWFLLWKNIKVERYHF